MGLLLFHFFLNSPPNSRLLIGVVAVSELFARIVASSSIAFVLFIPAVFVAAAEAYQTINILVNFVLQCYNTVISKWEDCAGRFTRYA